MQLFFFRRTAPLAAAFAVTFALIAPVAGAAQDDTGSTSADGVGVARISLIEGSVAVQRGDSTDSLTAAPNAPVLGGDYVTTGNSSRAEIQLDGYSQVRLAQDVQMRFTHLDTNNRSLQLAAGTLDLRLLSGPGGGGSNDIDTPSITVKPRQAGSYRVTVTPDGQTLVTVRSGDAEIDTPQGVQDLQPGSTLVAQGESANPVIRSETAVVVDDFDRFNEDRDRAHAPALASAQYVNPNIDGVEDLNANGRWVTDGSYGHVWVPASVGPDWAPYRDGRWVWEDGYGWTWIANERWGWAPYHYGSWYNSPNYGWCWYPPQPRVYVPWRPALVAFIGFGAGSGLSLSFGGGNAFGNIGWVPLAPFEPYHPWWGDRYGYRGGTVVNNITNITNVTNVTNINVYKNVRYNAVSSVSSQRFLQGNFTRNVAVRAPQLRQAQVFHGALPIVPTASNLRFADSTAPAPVAVRPALMQHAFAGNTTAVNRTPFTTQRVAFATATHATVTPLHFKDAQTTPLVPNSAVQHASPQNAHPITASGHPSPAYAQPATTSGHPVPTYAHPNATSERPAAGSAATIPAATNPWARFHDARSPRTGSVRNPPPGEPNSNHPVQVINGDRTQSGATTDRVPVTVHDPAAVHAPATVNEYRAPAAPNAYHIPANAARSTLDQHQAASRPAHVTQAVNASGSRYSGESGAGAPRVTHAAEPIQHHPAAAPPAARGEKGDTTHAKHDTTREAPHSETPRN